MNHFPPTDIIFADMRSHTSFYYLAAISILFTTSCTTIHERLATYHGLHKNQLIADMGTPDEIVSDGGNGEIWIYQEEVVSVRSGSEKTYVKKEDDHKYKPDAQTVYTPPRESVRLNNRTFFIDKRGVIYDTAYNSRSVRR